MGWRSKEIRWLYVVVLVRAERAALFRWERRQRNGGKGGLVRGANRSNCLGGGWKMLDANTGDMSIAGAWNENCDELVSRHSLLRE